MKRCFLTGSSRHRRSDDGDGRGGDLVTRAKVEKEEANDVSSNLKPLECVIIWNSYFSVYLTRLSFSSSLHVLPNII